MGKKKYKKYQTFAIAGVFFLYFFPNFSKNSDNGIGHVRVQRVNVASLPCAKTENPYGWQKMGAYTTYFNQNDRGRCENIAIAASLIDGVTIQPYGEFSFNQTVGKRTKEAGFQKAKIIVDGEYVEGVGGGVCQVSTTLYNALLKSGLTVEEYHPHSLKVAYVEASRDAMVSSCCDLKFSNPYPFPVYLFARVCDGGVAVRFYGAELSVRYEISTRVLEEISPPPDIVKEGEEEKILRNSQPGVKSEMYLECYRGKRLLSRKCLRRDEYRPIQGIIVKKNANATNKMG